MKMRICALVLREHDVTRALSVLMLSKSDDMNRRDFLIMSAFAAGARALMAAPPNLHFPTAPRDRLAVASYSFRPVIDTPRNRARDAKAVLIDLKQFPVMIAERYNIHNVELLGQHLRSTEPAYLDEIRAAVKSAGSHVVN